MANNNLRSGATPRERWTLSAQSGVKLGHCQVYPGNDGGDGGAACGSNRYAVRRISTDGWNPSGNGCADGCASHSRRPNPGDGGSANGCDHLPAGANPSGDGSANADDHIRTARSRRTRPPTQPD